MASPRRLASRRSALLLVTLAVLAVGCQDYATAPDTSVLPGAATHGSMAGTGGAGEVTSPYTCFTSIATARGPHKYRYGRLQLTFPKEALAPDGSTMSYRYRGYSNGAELDRLADCTIPRSAAAVAMMHRRFGVKDKQVKMAGETSDGSLTVMSDPSQIDGIVITACQYGGEYPNCSPPPTGYQEDPNPPATECSTYCDPWSDDGGGGSGGSDPDWYWQMGEGNDEAPTYCHSASTGCTLYSPSSEQRQKIAGEIAKIRTDGICGEAKAKALELLNNEPSRFKLWDGDVRDPDGYLMLGDFVVRVIPDPAEIHLSSKDGITAQTIVHEAIHVLGKYHGFVATFPDGTTRVFDGKSSTDVLGRYCG